LIDTEDRVQTEGRKATGDSRAPASFGLSSFCLFLCENWHKKNIRGIGGERERRQGEEGETGFTGDVEFLRGCPQIRRAPTRNFVSLAAI
jgi:hypothetical protein